jgi:o-succinylbenzoate synthase
MFYSYIQYNLLFKKPVKTSRNELSSHQVFYILAFNNKTEFDKIEPTNDDIYVQKLILQAQAVGEAAPLKGLSLDESVVESSIIQLCSYLNNQEPLPEDFFESIPAVDFAFQTLQFELASDKAKKIFDTQFYNSNSPIEINGLVWMSNSFEMEKEAYDKIDKGFTTIKFKVGALDFDDECRMLETFRKQFNAFKITIRLDANGAFLIDDALAQLKELARFEIHSIEQPIKAKQCDAMQELCAETPIPIALDEELIGIDFLADGQRLLQHIKPQHIILKPTLLGGLKNSDAWVKLAQHNNIGCWATSALESNIGLNAIAQWTATKNLQVPHGLGTGSLYSNNISSPLVVSNGQLVYDKSKKWELGEVHKTAN